MNTPAPEIRLLLGVPFHPVNMSQAIEACDEIIRQRKPQYIATANVDFIAQAYHDDDLRNILFFAFRVVCDGMPLVWFSRFVNARLPERVAGSDMVFEVFKLASANRYRIYFLGSDEGTLARAKAKIEQLYEGVTIAGHFSPPYAPLHEWPNDAIITSIREAKPDILMVAVGCPKQERWIYQHHEATGVPLSLGIGASLDFIAGKQTRCPVWMQKSGLEWLWRLGTDPRRLASRYARDFYFLIKLGFLQWKLTRRKRELRFTEKDSKAKIAYRSRKAQVLEWKGPIDATSAKDAAVLVEAPDRPILIDTSQVTFMDSTGLGKLVQQARYCRDAKKPFGLLEPSRFVRRLIDSLRMEAQLPIYASVGSFYEQTQAPFKGSVNTAPACEVLKVSGAVDRNSISVIEQRVMSVMEQMPASATVRLDFTEVRFIDSFGIGRLCHLKKTGAARGVHFWLTNVAGTPLNVLRMVCLEKLLVKNE